MNRDKLRIYGKKGKGSAPDPPVEEPDTLQSKSMANLVDLLCEGEISGWANSDNIYKSTYFNEIPVMASDDTMNFEGVNLIGRKGTSNQEYLRGFDTIENEVDVSTQVTKDGGAVQAAISNTDVDDVKITLSVPTLLVQESDGDVRKTVVNYRITVQGNGGNERLAIQSSIYGKTTNSYQKQHVIRGISTYGSAPWTIRVYRDTNDSSSIRLSNDLYWSSYTEVTNVKLRYMDSVVVGTNLDSQYFGGDIPFRAWKIKGLKIKIPSNYDPDSRIYTGAWDGTFTTAYSNNPAWVVYDILTNERYGVGLDASQVDKWSLYTIGVYCDGNVTVTTKSRNASGGYDEVTSTEPRFTFNGVIQSRAEALAVINHLCSVFRGFPIWTTGQVSFVQDAPKSVSKVASPANVVDGMFEYESSPRSMRHTAAKVSYNDANNFGKLDVVTIEDDDGIVRYGYQPLDITAFGCNSRNEAIRRGKYVLYTDINQTELVKFRGGLEWANAIPGDLVAVQDPNYSNMILSGRVISSTTNQITVDRDVEIESGVTYTLYVQSTSGAVIERELTNAVGTWNVLTWANPTAAPIANEHNWVISTSSVATRNFVITRVGEQGSGVFEINGILYDSNKYSDVEDGLVIETPPASNLVGKVEPPSSVDIQAYTYTETDQSVRKYGMIISWVASTDPRTDDYELRYRIGDNQGWTFLGTTGQVSFDFRDVVAGVYDVSVRARGVAGNSNWAYYNDFTMIAAVSGAQPPTNLQVKGGGTTFSGRDIEIEWDASNGTSYSESPVPSASVGNSNVIGYKVEVYDTDDTFLRSFNTESREKESYTYTLQMNIDDHSGTPQRQIKFKVYTIDVYGNLSATAATMTASNPAPDLSSSTPTVTAKAGFLKVEWTKSTDNDMEYYNVYFGTASPPTTLYEVINHPNAFSNIMDVTTAESYYVQIEPYDEFGVGTKSQISGAVTPLEIPAIDVVQELEQSVSITDSYGHDIELLRRLYDHDYTTGGILYEVDSADEWIQYAYGIKNYIDRLAIWTGDANARVYVAYSDDDGVTWDYLKVQSNHTPRTNDAGGSVFDYATNQANAKANYWQLVSGKNTCLFPNNIVANKVRVWLVGASYQSRIYEIIPSRLIVSELAALEFLSAISANIGTITAGNVQSSNFGTTTGMNIDLDAKRIYLKGSQNPTLYYDDATGTLEISAIVTFQAGSSGYSSITDAPSGLNELDAVAYEKLGTIARGATDDSSWRHPSDETLIDGGKLYVGSQITLSEGGYAIFGNRNVIIETVGERGSIVVSEDGGPVGNNYCELSDGDLQFYYWNGVDHEQYAGLSRIEVGTAENNQVITIPGIFKERPKIIVSPNYMNTFDVAQVAQSQAVRYEVVNVNEYEDYKWKFTARATLEAADGAAQTPVEGEEATRSVGVFNSWDDVQSATVNLIPNVRNAWVTIRGYGYTYSTSSAYICDGPAKDAINCHYVYTVRVVPERYYLYLYFYVSGEGWKSISEYVDPGLAGSPTRTTDIILNTGLQASDITQIYAYLDHHTVVNKSWYYSGSWGTATKQGVDIISYSSDLSAAQVLAGGTLNWLAVGR